MKSIDELAQGLSGAGIGGNEARVYVALLITGLATSGRIASEAKLNHTRAYEALDRLRQKGLVSYVIKNNVRNFKAAEPDAILGMMRQKEERLQEIAAELSALRKEEQVKPTAMVYEGKPGLKMLLNIILDSSSNGGEYLDFGVSGQFKRTMGVYWEVWQRRKRKEGVKSRVIFDEGVRGTELAKEYIGEARFIDSKYHCPSDTFIFGECIAIFVWTAKVPTAILIKDRITSRGYHNVFEWMWANSKK
jgi:predicted transcriptional regulator